ELFFIDDLVRRAAWEELPAAVAAYLDRYPNDVSLHPRALAHLGRAVNNTNVPPAARRAAFDVHSVRIRHHAHLISGTRNYLAGLGLSADETLRLAERAAYACGSNVNSRVYLWQFLQRAAPAAGADSAAWRAACRRFLARYGKAHAEARAVQLALLEQDVREQVPGAAEQLATARQADRAANDALNTAFAAAREALAAGRAEAALAALNAALEAAPPHAVDLHWSRLLNDKLLPSLPPDVLASLLAFTLDRAPTGQATEVARNLARNVLKGHPREGPLLIAYLERHVEDVQIATGTALYLTRHVPTVAADPELAVQAARASMAAVLRLGARDSAAEYAFLCARGIWSRDRAAAERLLEQAITLAPASRDAARAGWFLAFLRGEIDFARPPLPRGEPPPEETPAVWPEGATPVHHEGHEDREGRATASRLAERESTVNVERAMLNDEGTTVPAWDADEDLAAGQAARAVLAPEQVGRATDDDPESAWMPPQTPAVLVVPLRRAAPVRRVVVRTTDACYFVVTLHDAAGRALARAERDWRFPDHSDFWPSTATTLDFLPGETVHAVSIELTTSRGASAGVAGVAVFGTRHPLETSHPFAPAPLPAAARALRIGWQADEPATRVAYRADLESARGFVITRWLNPWPRAAGPIRLGQIGGHLGLTCYGGANVTLRLDRAGIVDWRFADGAAGTITQTNTAEAAYGLLPRLAPGRHPFTLGRRALPAAGDRWGADDIRFVSLEMEGRARVGGAIRFGDGRARWGTWLGQLTNGAVVAVPAGATHYQMRADFDSREVLGQAAARLHDWSVTPADPTSPTSPTSPTGLTGPTSPTLPEDLAAAQALVAARGVVATYPRAGCRREYEAARRLAERAGLYLVSDDHALNNYDGLPLVVGRPLTHRYARQAVAMAGLWNDAAYLNNPTGVVAVVRRRDGAPWYVLVIGETVGAVEAASARLLAALPGREPAAAPFRLFGADTLEVVYPWLLHPARPAPEALRLRLGVNDRRSLQLGLAAERDMARLRAELGPLRRADGTVLAAETAIRYTGCYEWDGFFGDLRLPNALLPRPHLPLPANTALGIWLTVQTVRGAQPGRYTGSLTVEGGGARQQVPVELTIEPVVLPDDSGTAFYSFARPAWWFQPGTPLYTRAARELARNEARLGVQWLGTTVLWRLKPAGARFTLDLAPWEEALRLCEAEYAALGLPPPGFLGPFDDLNALARIVGTNDTAWVARQAAEQLAAFLQRTGRSKRFILKVSDEPRSLAEWMTLARPWREGGLRVMTCHSGNDATLEAAVGTMDPWCPNYQHDVLKPFFRERQRAGDAVWWYCCGVPPTRLTGRPEDNLPFYWLTAKWRFDGAMNYAAHSLSPHSVETSPVPFRYEHGLSHRLLFLPDGSLLDTWRRELEGDGIRDNRLIAFIRARLDVWRKDTARRAEAAALEQRLDNLLERIVPYKYGYAATPDAWRTARDELYDLAARLGAGT
ncbi:MAG: hypothetical protein GX590_07170, partial [Lentisphaerae bacterium]|nr:hypothetical protein [Lentisphaerota bacterium]